MKSSESKADQSEENWLHYQGNEIPWYVRVVWIGFWCFAIYYSIQFVIPSLQREVFAP